MVDTKDKKALYAEYEKLYQKKPFYGWTVEQLEIKISDKQSEEIDNATINEQKSWEDMTEEERKIAATQINSHFIQTVSREPVQIIMNDESFAIVNNKYIPYNVAMVGWKKQQIQKLEREIKALEI